MFSYLMPREVEFFELFRKSAHNVIDGCRHLRKMVNDFSNPAESARQLRDIEHIGDGITHDIVRKLNQTFITPIDREDIHDLASALDDVLDLVEEIADHFIVYKIEKPNEASVQLAEILCQAAEAVGVAVDQLGNPRANITDYCVRINSLENEADRVVRQAISTLFEREKDPIAVLKWKEIYQAFEDGADRCEDVSNVLERIVVKHH